MFTARDFRYTENHISFGVFKIKLNRPLGCCWFHTPMFKWQESLLPSWHVPRLQAPLPGTNCLRQENLTATGFCCLGELVSILLAFMSLERWIQFQLRKAIITLSLLHVMLSQIMKAWGKKNTSSIQRSKENANLTSV